MAGEVILSKLFTYLMIQADFLLFRYGKDEKLTEGYIPDIWA